MRKTVKKIADAVNEIMNEYYFHDDVAMRILEAAAGGAENVADFIEENDSSCEDEDDCPVFTSKFSYVGSQNSVRIPRIILKKAEEINGKLNSEKNGFGALTIIPDISNKRYTVLFGDHVAEYDDARLIHLSSSGEVKFSARGIYCKGNSIEVILYKDGKIVID